MTVSSVLISMATVRVPFISNVPQYFSKQPIFGMELMMFQPVHRYLITTNIRHLKSLLPSWGEKN
jgi:hypothetical protein